MSIFLEIGTTISFFEGLSCAFLSIFLEIGTTISFFEGLSCAFLSIFLEIRFPSDRGGVAARTETLISVGRLLR